MKAKQIWALVASTLLVTMLIAIPFMTSCSEPTPAPPTPTPVPSQAPTPAPVPPPEPIEMEVALLNPDLPGDTSDSCKWWMNEVEKRTQGKVNFTCYWGGSLAGPMELLEVVRLRQVHMVQMVGGAYIAEFPLSLVGAGPIKFHYTDAPAAVGAWWQLYKEFPEIEAEFSAQNVKVLTHAGAANTVLFSNKPIKSLADLEGLKSYSGGKYAPILFKEAGCVPVVLPTGEVADGLRKGLLNVALFSFSGAKLFGLQEAAKYVVQTDLGSSAPLVCMLMNLDVWNELPKDVQQVMLQVNEEYHDAWAEMYYKDDKGGELFFIEQGLEYSKLPVAEMEKWSTLPGVVKMADDWIAEMEAKGLPGRQAAERWIELEPEMEALYSPDNYGF